MNKKTNTAKKGKKTKIAIFYDGYSLIKLGRHLNATHDLYSGIDFAGYNAYIFNTITEKIKEKDENCIIVGKHLYMGLKADKDCNSKEKEDHKEFKDSLSRDGIEGHFRDLKVYIDPTTSEVKLKEKMVDMDLGLDALEMALNKKFDVFVLAAGDSDHVPLIEKMKKLNITSVLFWWETDDNNDNIMRASKKISASNELIDIVTHHIEMKAVLGKRRKTKLEEGIFIKKVNSKPDKQQQNIKEQPKIFKVIKPSKKSDPYNWGVRVSTKKVK